VTRPVFAEIGIVIMDSVRRIHRTAERLPIIGRNRSARHARFHVGPSCTIEVQITVAGQRGPSPPSRTLFSRSTP